MCLTCGALFRSTTSLPAGLLPRRHAPTSPFAQAAIESALAPTSLSQPPRRSPGRGAADWTSALTPLRRPEDVELEVVVGACSDVELDGEGWAGEQEPKEAGAVETNRQQRWEFVGTMVSSTS